MYSTLFASIGTECVKTFVTAMYELADHASHLEHRTALCGEHVCASAQQQGLTYTGPHVRTCARPHGKQVGKRTEHALARARGRSRLAAHPDVVVHPVDVDLAEPGGKPRQESASGMPNLTTKIIPTKVCWPNISGKSPMDMIIPPLNIKIMLESNPLKSRSLVWRLAVDVSAVKAAGDGRRVSWAIGLCTVLAARSTTQLSAAGALLAQLLRVELHEQLADLPTSARVKS